MSNQREQNLRLYDAIAHEDALDAAQRRDLTADERDEAHGFIDSMRARVFKEQHARRSQRPRVPIRPSILAMTRDALTRRLGELFAAHPGAVFAHRNLTSMSDHDLRLALEDVESLAERQS